MTEIHQNKATPILIKKESSNEHYETETSFFKVNNTKIKIIIYFKKIKSVKSSTVEFYEWTSNGWTQIQTYKIIDIVPEHHQKIEEYEKLGSHKQKDFLKNELNLKNIFSDVSERAKDFFINW